MASVVVLDSGILLATFLEEEWTEKAEGLLAHWKQQGVQIAAPTLFMYEVVAVIRRTVWQDRMSPEDARDARDALLDYDIQYYVDAELLKRAYELATEHNRPTAYDSEYLAVAERLNCEFWTADQRLFNAVREQLNWVKWVGDFEGSQA